MLIHVSVSQRNKKGGFMTHNNIVDIDSCVYHNVEDLFTVVGASEENIEKLTSAPYSYWRETIKQVFKKPLAVISIVVLLLLVFLTIFGPMMSFHEYLGPDKEIFESPDGNGLGWNSVNWFGTGSSSLKTYANLDLWTVVWMGTRLSLLLATVVALIDTFLGILIGSLWGYFRKLDPILIELRNFVSNIPDLLLYFLLMQFLKPSFWVIVFLLCMFGWMGLAGFIRNQIIIIRNRDYNIASITLGSSSKSMIIHNLLPYLISVIVTVVSTAIPAAISSEVGLAFFGLSFSFSNGDVTLGQLLTDVTNTAVWQTNPNQLIVPLIVLVPLTVTFFYLGLVLADATDPKNHR